MDHVDLLYYYNINGNKTYTGIKFMRLTTEIIKEIQLAMVHTKKDGSINWQDGDEIEVNLAGTFAADKFIVINNKTKKPVVSAAPHPYFDYEKGVFIKDGREEYMKEQKENKK